MIWPEHCGVWMVYLGDQDTFLEHKPKTPRVSPKTEAHYYCKRRRTGGTKLKWASRH